MRHHYAASNKRGMHTYSQAVPRMPWVQDLSELNNMGVVLFTCITRTEPILVWRKRRLASGRPRRVLTQVAVSSPYRVLAVCIIVIISPPERVVRSTLFRDGR